MKPTDFLWTRGDAAVLLLALPVIIFFFYLIFFRKRQFSSPFLPAPNRSWFKTRLNALLLISAFALGIFALMGPSRFEYFAKGEGFQKSPLLIALDTSRSMGVEDVAGYKNRLEKAKEIADLLLRKNLDREVALWIFGGVPEEIVPMTFDSLFIRLMVRDLEVGEQGIEGTDFQALFDELKSSSKAAPLVILLTDGESTTTAPPPTNSPFKIVTIAIGTPSGGKIPGLEIVSKLDESWLQMVAEKSRGLYVPPLIHPKGVVERVQEIVDASTSHVDLRSDQIFEEPLFQVPLFFAIIFLLLAFMFCEKKGVLFLFLLWSYPVFAIDNLQTINEVEAGNFLEGKNREEEFLRGPLLPWQKERVLYNLGTIALLQKNFDEAIKYFEQMKSLSDVAKLNLALAFYQAALLDERVLTKLYKLDQGEELAEEALPSKRKEELLLAIRLEIENIAASISTIDDKFSLALVLTPVQIKTLEDLKSEYPKNTFLEDALVSLKSGNEEKARLYLLLAKEVQMRGEPPNEPQEILKELIEKEELSLWIHRLSIRQNMQSDNVFSFEKTVEKWVEAFKEEVKKKEEAIYQHECTLWPWAAVLPKFYSGVEKREAAIKALGTNRGASLQEEALALWKEALRAFSLPQPQATLHGAQEEFRRDFVKMVEEDKQKEVRKSTLREGVRPW